MQASIRFGMELISLSHISGVILSQILCIASFNWSMLLSLNICSWWSTHDQRFSIGFRSGHLAGQGSIIIFSANIYSLMEPAVWHGALPCWKYQPEFGCIGLQRTNRLMVSNIRPKCLYIDIGWVCHRKSCSHRYPVQSCSPKFRPSHLHPEFCIEVCQADTCHFSSSKHETYSFCWWLRN